MIGYLPSTEADETWHNQQNAVVASSIRGKAEAQNRHERGQGEEVAMLRQFTVCRLYQP